MERDPLRKPLAFVLLAMAVAGSVPLVWITIDYLEVRRASRSRVSEEVQEKITRIEDQVDSLAGMNEKIASLAMQRAEQEKFVAEMSQKLVNLAKQRMAEYREMQAERDEAVKLLKAMTERVQMYEQR
jgi:hypothetical protein